MNVHSKIRSFIKIMTALERSESYVAILFKHCFIKLFIYFNFVCYLIYVALFSGKSLSILISPSLFYIIETH